MWVATKEHANITIQTSTRAPSTAVTPFLLRTCTVIQHCDVNLAQHPHAGCRNFELLGSGWRAWSLRLSTQTGVNTCATSGIQSSLVLQVGIRFLSSRHRALSKGSSRYYPQGGHIFFRPLHPQDTHGVRAPRPPGHVSALINLPHYGSNTPWPPGQVTSPPPTPRTHCQQNTLHPQDKKVFAPPPRIISGTALMHIDEHILLWIYTNKWHTIMW